jgi:hypothetical protein
MSLFVFWQGKIEAEFSLVTGEDAIKNPVGKAHEGPQPLEEPKLVLIF